MILIYWNECENFKVINKCFFNEISLEYSILLSFKNSLEKEDKIEYFFVFGVFFFLVIIFMFLFIIIY